MYSASILKDFYEALLKAYSIRLKLESMIQMVDRTLNWCTMKEGFTELRALLFNNNTLSIYDIIW
ncbi:unnamed protein product [Arabis nemorensis]|uniref:Uncharacterized protein n=1 Tax=Arabis nemorensis TaxID=586526 RepID=A0A565CBM1_9BRAS|nr:unnamed protein product [Arabis nemorensis]